jgi:hypothetical protein
VDLAILNGLAQLQAEIYLGYIIIDDERIWRKPLFETPPLEHLQPRRKNLKQISDRSRRKKSRRKNKRCHR